MHSGMFNYAQRCALRPPTAPVTLLSLSMVIALSPNHVRSLHWWQSPRVIHVLALGPSQIVEIDRAFERQSPERYRWAESATALLRQVEESNAVAAEDEELLSLTSALVEVTVKGHQSNILRMRDDVARILRPDQRVRLSQLVSTRQLDIE